MILIVGGAGYIGSHINKELYKKSYETLIFDNLSGGHKESVKWGSFIEGDLCDIEELRELFKKTPIKAVIYCGGYSLVGESIDDPEKYYTNNVINTLNLLKVMREFSCKYLIFSSSCSIYGDPVEIPISEDHPISPINPYGRSKSMIEDILRDYSKSYGLEYISLRYFNAAGADKDLDIGERHNPETHLIPLVLDVALGKKENIEIFGDNYETKDGTCIRDYIHVSDLAKAHILALESLLLGDGCNVYNLGNSRGYSVREIINTAQKITGKKIKYIIGGKREGDPAVLISSCEKIEKKLGWHPEITDLEEIIKSAWDWQKRGEVRN